MRKLLSLIPLLIIMAACQKTVTTPYASAAFERSINGSDLWDWDFTNKTADDLSLTQTYYTGSLTGGKQSRWTFAFVDPQTPVNIFFTFPGTDSSASLLIGKDMTFAFRITDSSPSLVTCALNEMGSLYTGSDSTLMNIDIQSLAGGMISGTFSVQLYSPTATVMITQGHFTNVPVTLATQ
jgi:hypothetical protein